VPLLLVMIVLARHAAMTSPDQAPSPVRERAGQRVQGATDITGSTALVETPARADALHPPPAPPSREGGKAAPHAASSTTITSTGHWPSQLVFSVGAGIYEELLFRLIAIALLHLLIVDLFKVPHKVGATLAVLISSVAFALYHFSEANPFAWASFTAYMVAGVYFALIYLGRGFGIAVGVHAMYDVFVVVLNQAQA
jgi:hypothetical protein